MKLILVVIVAFVALILGKCVVGDRTLRVEDVLPMSRGNSVSLYDLTALGMVLIAILAITKMLRRRNDDE